MDTIKKTLISIHIFVKSLKKKALRFIDSYPLISFFVVLTLLVGVIAIGNTLRKPRQEKKEEKNIVKNVEIFSIGTSPKISFSGRVEKSGVVKIVAQSAGVVQTIHRAEGARVSRGTILLHLSTNYQGGTTPSLSRQIAQRNKTLTEEHYPIQKELIAKRREIAEKNDAMADDMRRITNDSIQNTKQLINLNREILATINDNIKTLEDTNVGGSNNALILQAKQAKAGVLSGLNGLETSLRNAEYTSGEGNPQARLSDLAREIALKQLEIEEKALESGKEIARLNLLIAQITESLMFPASPCNGVIDRIYPQFGTVVNPGQPLASIRCDTNATNLVVLVPKDVVEHISRFEQSVITRKDQSISLLPRYISQEPTDGTLYAVLFDIPQEFTDKLGEDEIVSVHIPVGNPRSLSSIPYIPIDAVFQTQRSSIVYVATQSTEGQWTASGRVVTLGQVFGSFVEIVKGINAEDQIIVTRNVIAGDEVRF